MHMYDLSVRFEEIKGRISCAVARTGRVPEDISIMAVTKMQPYDAVQAACAQGIHLIGENRVQEAMEKIPSIQSVRNYQVHLIGHLQKNKARKAARFFDMIQSLDDPETLGLLDDECGRQGRKLDILIELNTSGESAKHGLSDPDDVQRLLDCLLKKPNLRACGLMTVGPLGNDDSANRRAFSTLKTVFDRIAGSYRIPEWNVLSMGMSQDFESAIEEGSTLVRLGTILFGSRS